VARLVAQLDVAAEVLGQPVTIHADVQVEQPRGELRLAHVPGTHVLDALVEVVHGGEEVVLDCDLVHADGVCHLRRGFP